MRDIFFRGKRVDNGEWVYGGFSHDVPYTCRWTQDGNSKEFIITWCECFLVKANTVGQYTGLTDKNGEKVFDGDVLKWDEKEWGGPSLEVVKWDYGQFDMRKNDWPQFCEVIGNIFDNPELLEGGDIGATEEERV